MSQIVSEINEYNKACKSAQNTNISQMEDNMNKAV